MFASDIINEGARLFLVHRRDIVGDYRFAFLQPARRAIMIAMRERGASLPQIGKWMNRHHTSVMHAIALGRYRMEKDSDYAEKVQHLISLSNREPVLSDEAAPCVAVTQDQRDCSPIGV